MLGTVRVQRRSHSSCPSGVHSLVKEKHVCEGLEGGNDHFLHAGDDCMEEVGVELVLKA